MRSLLREMVEWVLLPGLAALLPWSLHFRLLRRIARSDRLLRAETTRAAAGYRAFHGHSPDPAWLARHRLVLLVDRADAALIATRSDRWLDRHVLRSGRWPAGPCLAVTFHFSAGLWSMRDLHRAGHRASFVSRRFVREDFAGRLIPYLAARMRFSLVARAGGAPVIYTGGGTRAIRAAFADGRTVVGLIDVPPQTHGAHPPVRFMNREARFPSGMVELAAEAGIPIVGYVLGIDSRTGRRTIEVSAPLTGSPSAQCAELATMLDRAIGADSAAWQLWSCAPEFFAGGEAAP